MSFQPMWKVSVPSFLCLKFISLMENYYALVSLREVTGVNLWMIRPTKTVRHSQFEYAHVVDSCTALDVTFSR